MHTYLYIMFMYIKRNGEKLKVKWDCTVMLQGWVLPIPIFQQYTVATAPTEPSCNKNFFAHAQHLKKLNFCKKASLKSLWRIKRTCLPRPHHQNPFIIVNLLLSLHNKKILFSVPSKNPAKERHRLVVVVGDNNDDTMYLFVLLLKACFYVCLFIRVSLKKTLALRGFTFLTWCSERQRMIMIMG